MKPLPNKTVAFLHLVHILEIKYNDSQNEHHDTYYDQYPVTPSGPSSISLMWGFLLHLTMNYRLQGSY